mgnify:CR=1 FL=1
MRVAARLAVRGVGAATANLLLPQLYVSTNRIYTQACRLRAWVPLSFGRTGTV